jgi:predicted glycosyltransferase
MRVLVDMGHPGHVHFYKHVIRRLRERGHEVLISARDKDVTLALLDHYGFHHRTLSVIGSGRWGLFREFLQREWALLRLIREFDPDVVTAIGGLFIAPVCRLLGKPSVVFTDTEHVKLDRYLTYPLASAICTPECFSRDLDSRQVRYAGYQELAYLHPDYFQPDRTVLNEPGVSEGEPFIILRFVAWTASHDLGQRGFPLALRREAVKTLSRYGRVFITSEAELPGEFEPFRITVPHHRIHDLLAYARLYIGEGATMASEAALLGTPSVYVNTLRLGYLEQMQHKYGLVFCYSDAGQAIDKAVELLTESEVKTNWQAKRAKLLQEKEDVTAFAVDFIERRARDS